jgi:hypothetical protein
MSSEAISAVLAQLSQIARAPLTADQRELRARSLVTGDVTLEALVAAVSRGDLDWNQQQAIEYEIDVPTWLEAVHLADLPRSDSLPALIERLHQAEAFAAILKAGYKPGRSTLGRLVWAGR